MGLSVSYGIVKEHKGEITVESEVGRGTTFAITIPLAPETTEDQTQAKSKDDEHVQVMSLR